MTFRVPEHLPRPTQTKERSTSIIEEISETSWSGLNSLKSKEWLEELDAVISDTMAQIVNRLDESSDEYRTILDTSHCVQYGVETLETQVQQLTHTLYGSKEGIITNLQDEILFHQTLTQEALNALMTYEAASFLVTCNDNYNSIAELLASGKVVDAVLECKVLWEILGGSPEFLNQTVKIAELQAKLRAIEAVSQDILLNEFRNHAFISQTLKGASLVVRHQVKFRGALHPISLSILLLSLNPSDLEIHLRDLRLGIQQLIVIPLTKAPYLQSLERTSASADRYELILESVSKPRPASSVLDDLHALINFLSDYLLPHLPSDSAPVKEFQHLFSEAFNVIVHEEIVKQLFPKVLREVPTCLEVAEKAAELEKLINMKLFTDKHNIDKWCDSLERLYEEFRVEKLLAKAREICESTSSERVRVVATDQQDEDARVHEERGEDESWGFDNDDWGFGDSEEAPNEVAKASSVTREMQSEDDGWGWKDDDEESALASQSQKPSTVPKIASRLEKISSKSRADRPRPLELEQLEPSSSTEQINPPFSTPILYPTTHRPEPSKKSAQETFTVATRATYILDHVESVLREAGTLRDSDIFGKHSRPAKRGRLLFQSAPAACDMLRSFFPVASQVRSSKEDLQLSCDFRYLSEKISHVYRARFENNKGDFDAKEESKWEETIRGLQEASKLCLQNAITSASQRYYEILESARGFKDINDDMNFRRIETAVHSSFRGLVGLAHEWKTILPTNDFYNAIGAVVDSALLKMVDDIVDLDDITEVESEKLAEICKQMEPVQNLFIDSNGESHVGIYVPSWFKFSYLKELLTASMADISYLFEQGMLMDYKVEELVKLLRALFADTPLREITIRNFLHEHPDSS